jgi:hypothetical protein
MQIIHRYNTPRLTPMRRLAEHCEDLDVTFRNILVFISYLLLIKTMYAKNKAKYYLDSEVLIRSMYVYTTDLPVYRA